ncbi:HARBI1 [Mytilus coruscus]|uniref:HARBI1 n=1 Tax=Mytilus coruscus TaxID=42192 RepID=A0A6J8BJ84_MYTCO|nr:HARBI1 [Mytilus coruscus]
MIEGVRRAKSKLDSRLPLTRELLEKIIGVLPSLCSSKFETKLFTAAFLLAFHGLFRVGELTVGSKGIADHAVLFKNLKRSFLHKNKLNLNGSDEVEFFLDFWGKFKDYFGEVELVNDPEKWKILQEMDSRRTKKRQVRIQRSRHSSLVYIATWKGIGHRKFGEMKLRVTISCKRDYQSEVGDIHGISTSSASRIIHRVCSAINSCISNIQFPRDADLTAVKEGFYRIATFPNVIGAIDGTLIPIQSLSDDEPNFVCRKGYHAINVQAVVDHKLRFTNVVVRWPGSTNDAFILQQSALYRHMDRNLNAGRLLGDSGYPLKVWLITPLANPSNPQEQRFNNSHCKTRNRVERAFGVLKQRFRYKMVTSVYIKQEEHFLGPERSTNIIETCFRLHNLAVEKNIPLNLDQPLPILHNDHINQQQSIAAQALRNQIIQR